jgi:hypothetical protein
LWYSFSSGRADHLQHDLIRVPALNRGNAMHRLRTLRTCIPVLAAGLALGITSCASAKAGSGPLQALAAGGQPEFAVAWGLEVPGQSADMTAFVVNSAHDPVTLVSAGLIPIPDQPTGHLRHAAVGIHHDGVAASDGWPPGIPVGPFSGARLPHGQSNIIFGFEGPDIGRNYMTAGVKITYRYHGQLYTTQAWSAAVACVTGDLHNANLSACKRASQVARRATEKLAGI